MRTNELLKLQAQEAHKEFLDSIDGVTGDQAWARVECQPGEYLHSEGSILSIVAHVAACQVVYGSMAYRNLELRWRDTVERLESFWPSWEGAKAYLHEAHDYWMKSWADEEDFERMVPRFDGQLWPSWKIVWMMAHHDGYHAAQIQVLRSILPPSSEPPPEEGDLWRKACEGLPSW